MDIARPWLGTPCGFYADKDLLRIHLKGPTAHITSSVIKVPSKTSILREHGMRQHHFSFIYHRIAYTYIMTQIRCISALTNLGGREERRGKGSRL
jgi:hypothetical protein